MRKASRNLKRITLSRETLLGLTSPRLRQAVGGITVGPNCTPDQTDACSAPWCTGANSRCGC
jgi:hypothetical protein